jgi:nitrate reductase delta subunit
MTQDKQKLIFKIFSLLLQYPDEAFYEHLPELKEAALGLWPLPDKDHLAGFFSALQSRPRLKVQEDYTAAFDLAPATTLNMTYHIEAEGEKRAGLLVDLQQAYGAAGYERSSGELPDYLPLILEFLSVCPDARHIDGIGRCLIKIDHLAEGLGNIDSLYCGLVRALSYALRQLQEIDSDSGVQGPRGQRPGQGQTRALAQGKRSPS